MAISETIFVAITATLKQQVSNFNLQFKRAEAVAIAFTSVSGLQYLEYADKILTFAGGPYVRQ